MKFQDKIQNALDNYEGDWLNFKDVEIAGDDCVLVCPKKAGNDWNKHNLVLRSVIYRKSDFYPVSLSYRKFFNWNEAPDLDYTPFSTTANGGIDVMEKRDGSTLIVSKYKGELIVRTRGTTDATGLENGHEIEELKKKFPKVFSELDSAVTSYISYIYEWETPSNLIVIDHEEPNLVLTGLIDHRDYSLVDQATVDAVAKKLKVERPKRFHYDKIKEMLDDVVTWEGCEGVVVYSQNGQSMRKIKADEYLRIHRLKSRMASPRRVLEFYINAGCPNYINGYKLIEETIDYEVAERCKDDLSSICWANDEIQKEIRHVKSVIENYKGKPSDRSEQAKFVYNEFDQKWRGIAFGFLDGKEVDLKKVGKLIKEKLDI